MGPKLLSWYACFVWSQHQTGTILRELYFQGGRIVMPFESRASRLAFSIDANRRSCRQAAALSRKFMKTRDSHGYGQDKAHYLHSQSPQLSGSTNPHANCAGGQPIEKSVSFNVGSLLRHQDSGVTHPKTPVETLEGQNRSREFHANSSRGESSHTHSTEDEDFGEQQDTLRETGSSRKRRAADLDFEQASRWAMMPHSGGGAVSDFQGLVRTFEVCGAKRDLRSPSAMVVASSSHAAALRCALSDLP